MDADEQTFLVALSSIALSVTRFPSPLLFRHFPTARSVFEASTRELLDVEGLPPVVAERIRAFCDFQAAEGQIRRIERLGVRIVPYYAAEYPENLRYLTDAPPVLYVRGVLERPGALALAVIGSRKATPYGIEVCQQLTAGLVGKGFCIVSGMARGIDAIAHWSAIENRGTTVAVMGTGVDVVYPGSHSNLYARIVETGAVISEFALGTGPYAWNFPRRNRIISGLSLGVLVVEAAERSGTMITVRMALEQGREVFAVPGDIRSERSRGTHRLIKQGAKLVDRLEDILEEFHLPCVEEREPAAPGEDAHGGGRGEGGDSGVLSQGETARGDRPDQERGGALSREAAVVLQVIGSEGTLLDRIVARSGLPPSKVAGILTELEILGKVRAVAGNRYQRLI
jgi:DNA processing protein